MRIICDCGREINLSGNTPARNQQQPVAAGGLNDLLEIINMIQNIGGGNIGQMLNNLLGGQNVDRSIQPAQSRSIHSPESNQGTIIAPRGEAE